MSKLANRATPHVVYGDPNGPVRIDAKKAARLMLDLGVSADSIARSVIYIDHRNRLVNNGTHYSNWLGRLRFRSIPELQSTEGDIIRITTLKRGRPRSVELMNKTLVHEAEHLAQSYRNDIKVMTGWATIITFVLLGVYGATFTPIFTPLAVLIEVMLGYETGYMLAPHERQARLRANQVTTTAITAS